MAEVTPPLYMTVDATYNGDELGLPYRDLIGEGVVGADELKVTASTGLTVSVAAGACWVKGDSDADAQPTYRCRTDAAVTVTHDTADGTNPRIDLVVAQVHDSTFSGGTEAWALEIVKGTAAATPSAPALPDSALLLAQVAVAAGAVTLTSGDITDKRVRAQVGDGSAIRKVIKPSELELDSAGENQVIVAGASAFAIGEPVASGDALPGSPRDGQLFNLIVNATTVWHLVWIDAQSAWFFLGGCPLFDMVAADASTSSGTFAQLSGPELNIDFAGSYLCTIGAFITSGAAADDSGFCFGQMRVAGSSGAVACQAGGPFSHSLPGGGSSSSSDFITVAAGTLISEIRANQQTQGFTATAYFSSRWMKLTPRTLTGA